MPVLPFYRQQDVMDCGPTCLRMVAKYFGKNYSIDKLRKHAAYNKEGVSLLGIAHAAEGIGFKSTGVQLLFTQLIKEAPLPCIVHWNQNHFVVVTPKSTLKKIEVADPAHGIIKYTREEFSRHWLQTTDNVPGIALLLEPTPEFYKQKNDKAPEASWGFLLGYLSKYKDYFLQLVIGLLIASILQLIFPFLTQSIVDVGINTRNLQYIYILLFAQLFLFTGRTITEFIRSHLLLHIGTRINISILSDFWIKLMQLPLSYFDTKKTGDTLQRIGDHNRIQQFLTSGSLSALFSIINLLVFSVVLLVYNGW